MVTKIPAHRSVSPTFRLLAQALAATWLSLETRQGLRHRPDAATAHQANRFTLTLSYVVGAVGAIAASKKVPSARIHRARLAGWIGLALAAGGLGLRIWSFRTLGDYFTFDVQTSPDQPVITSGPYRIVRHPGYLGTLCVIVGLVFLLANWLSVVVAIVAVTTGLVYRIRIEEHALLVDIGERYRRYAAKRKRFLPFIW